MCETVLVSVAVPVGLSFRFAVVRGDAIPSCYRFRLNLEAPAFLELQETTYQKHKAEIAFEKECQRERRKQHTQGKPVSGRQCTDEIDALVGRARG